MYLIHCEHSRLCWVRTLSSSSAGCLSCLIVRPSHRCRRCRRRHHPWDICPVEASSPSLSGRGLVICPPCRHHHPQAVCPAEATSSSLSSGPRRLSPTSSSLSVGLVVCPPHHHRRPWATCPAKALLLLLSSGGSHRLSPTVVVVVVVGHPPHRRRRPQATCSAKASLPSLSGGSYVVCPPPLSLLSSLATPHIIVVVVVHGPFVPWRLRHRHCPVGALLSVPHVVVIIVHGSFVLRRPHPRRCLVGASSSLPHVVIVVVCGSFVLRKPHCHCRSVGLPPRRSSLTILALSSSSSSSGKGLIVVHVVIVVVWQRPRRPLLGYTTGTGNPHRSHDGYRVGTGTGMVLLTCAHTRTRGTGLHTCRSLPPHAITTMQ